jgi:Tfp pilus assembly protein PilN
MSVQFNLLPDVKLEFARQQKAKKLVYTFSFLATAVAIAIFVVSFVSVDILQKKLLDNAGKDIDSYSNKIKGIKDLGKILTIQNQLNSLPNLHQQKHYMSRLFVYLPQVTPTKIAISTVNIDDTAATIKISGNGDSIQTVNQFVDTLKFTSYVVGGDQSTKKLAFSNVILSTVGRDDKGANYSITANFDQALFTGTKDVALVVPQEITTRSVINSPDVNSPLFNGQDNSAPANGGQ